ncbi:hypothetical protein ACIGXM_31880 [Kitasatospora sp. NPDC052896]|uniref:hypothetical protein n=1 Tax=Kitasatospora sp. NPDC052896 TaxID=3364061 RepID=UPI0037C72D9B
MASQAWQITLDKRQAEEAEARRQAEEARKAEEAAKAEAEKQAKAKQPKVCTIPMNRDINGLMPCLLSAKGDVVIQNPEIIKPLVPVVWSLMGIDDLVECTQNPTFGKCASFAMTVLPTGRLKAVEALGEGVRGAVAASRLGRVGKLRDTMLLEGKPLGTEDSKGVWMVTPEDIQGMAKKLRELLGQPDTVTELPKGTVETWTFDGGNVNYRNFSSSGGAGDWSIDFTKELQNELGLKRYHAKH